LWWLHNPVGCNGTWRRRTQSACKSTLLEVQSLAGAAALDALHQMHTRARAAESREAAAAVTMHAQLQTAGLFGAVRTVGCDSTASVPGL
jgi:hypothetical protein